MAYCNGNVTTGTCADAKAGGVQVCERSSRDAYVYFNSRKKRGKCGFTIGTLLDNKL